MLTIQEQVALAPYTYLKIGGPARFFAVISSEEELQEALQFAKSKQVPFYIIGNGSNILVSDQGFPGLVVKMNLQKLDVDGEQVIAGAGVAMAKAASESVKHSLSGFAWGMGVPGTVGGSVYGNAGCFGGDMKSVVDEVYIFDTEKNTKHKIQNTNCEFAYRESIFKQHPEWIILEATLKLQKVDSAEKETIQAWMRKAAKARVTEQDIGAKTAGSTFKGIPITEESMNPIAQYRRTWKKGPNASWIFENRAGFMSAGFLIDMAGLKGFTVGSMMVSPKHANFLVNTGNATAEEAIMLIGVIKERVHRMFGVQLEEEIRYVGF